MAKLRLFAVSISLLSSGIATAAPFEFPDTAVYHYNVTYSGSWGPAAAELPWFQAQMNFTPRVTDYPCCPVILVGQQLPTGSSRDLKGLTQSPPGSISLLAPKAKIGIRLQGNGPVYDMDQGYYGVIKKVDLTRSTQLSSTDGNPWHWLKFQFDNAFKVLTTVSAYNRGVNGAPSDPAAAAQKEGADEDLAAKGYYLVDGKLMFPRPVDGLHLKYEQDSSGRFQAVLEDSWLNHYDVVLLAKSSKGHYSGNTIQHLRITNGRPNQSLRLHFLVEYEPYYDKDRSYLENTRFLFARKAWGSLSSRKKKVCIDPECIIGDSEKAPAKDPVRKPGPTKITEDEKKSSRIKPGLEGKLSKEAALRAIKRDRLFRPEIKLPQKWEPIAPARVAVRLVPAPGSDLNGVSLQFTAFRKSDNRVTRATIQRQKYSPMDARYHQPKFDPPLNQISPAPVEEDRYYLQIDDAPGTEYGFSCMVLYRSTGHNCTAGTPNESIISIALITSADGRTPRKKEFRKFEDAFAAYRVAQAYSADKYQPDEDAYLLFEIQFKKPN